MCLKTKTFEELTKTELYEILKLRSEIFIVEQEGCYQDIDDIDYRSLHIFSQDENGRVNSYLRLYYKEDEEETVQIGRVVTLTHGIGLGGKLLKKGVQTDIERMHAKCLFIDSRKDAAGFYEKEGFHICPNEELPYYEMRRYIK